MEKIDTKKLFQITEAAHACGLSRSTLMRLEKKGLLKPAYIAPDSGRRYYDNHNVARILQIEKFKAMGFGTEEIAGYFARGGEAEGLLAVLEERLHSLQRSVEEMRLRATESDQFSVQIVTLPAVTCCIQWHVGHTFAERYDAMYDFYSQCIREGCVLSDEPLFTMSDRQDYLAGYIGDTPYPFAVCVPVRPEKAPAGAVTLPECRALSVLYCGDYSNVDEAWLRLGRPIPAGRSKRGGIAPGLFCRWLRRNRGNRKGAQNSKKETAGAVSFLQRECCGTISASVSWIMSAGAKLSPSGTAVLCGRWYSPPSGSAD